MTEEFRLDETPTFLAMSPAEQFEIKCIAGLIAPAAVGSFPAIRSLSDGQLALFEDFLRRAFPSLDTDTLSENIDMLSVPPGKRPN